MKGDFSKINDDYARRNHFTQVLKQQGRVQLDSDWNAFNGIVAHQRRIRTIDTIGTVGAPLREGGFRVVVSPDGELLFTSGRMYVDGYLVETYPSTGLPIVSFSGNRAAGVADTNVDGTPLARGQWVQLTTRENPVGIITRTRTVSAARNRIEFEADVSALATDEQTDPRLYLVQRYLEQRTFPGAPPLNPPADGERTDLVYLEVRERHLTATEDPTLREVALGGPDTDTRVQTIARVRVMENVGPAEMECGDRSKEWESRIAPPDGRLTTRVAADRGGEDPCALGEAGGYRGLENRLYRVEIHDGNAEAPTFKWSRSNAAQTYAVEAVVPGGGGGTTRVRVGQTGKDAYLALRVGDWLEVSNEATDLNLEGSGMARITEISDRLITLGGDVAPIANGERPKLRRWDVEAGGTQALRDLQSGTEHQLEDGISIEFSGNTFRTGDYWTFTARTLTGEVELLEKARPQGIGRHYARLALLRYAGDGDPAVVDCRPVFPPLTELPESGGSCCHLCVGPEDRWWETLSQLPAETTLHVCFRAGFHQIPATVRLRNLGNVVLFGAGRGTTISLNTGEAALFFENCGDVTVRDLAVISTRDSLSDDVPEEDQHLNGAIACEGCRKVSLEGVYASCADSDSDRTEAACVSVRHEVVDGELPLHRTLIRDCEFEIGRNQIGALVINSTQVHVEGNHLSVRPGISAAALQGIVVAGELAPQVYVGNNIIEGVLQGIHLGFSNEQKEDPTRGYFRGDQVQVTGNRIVVTVLSAAHEKEERHGIFVGNSSALSIKDNGVWLVKEKQTRQGAFGIHIAGHCGSKLIVRHNYLEGAFGEVGIRVDAIHPIPKRTVWYIEQNVASVAAEDPEITVRENG